MKQRHFLKTGLAVSFVLAAFHLNGQNQNSTNNPLSDEIKKADWIKQHPEEYKQQGGSITAASPEFKSQQEKDNWIKSQEPGKKTAAEIKIEDIPNSEKEQPDFPQYIDTGNPEKDAADYRARKYAWYQTLQPKSQH